MSDPIETALVGPYRQKAGTGFNISAYELIQQQYHQAPNSDEYFEPDFGAIDGSIQTLSEVDRVIEHSKVAGFFQLGAMPFILKRNPTFYTSSHMAPYKQFLNYYRRRR